MPLRARSTTCCCSVKVSATYESLVLRETSIKFQNIQENRDYSAAPIIQFNCAADQCPKRAGYPTAEQICPIKISEKRVVAELFDAFAGTAAQALAWIFCAKLRYEILSFGSDIRSKKLEKRKSPN